MAWTTTELLADIRRRARLSTTDPDHTDANLLLDADNQMDELLIPLVLGVNSEFYVRVDNQTTVADQAEYPIPARCVASVPRQVFLISSDEQPVEPLPHVSLSERYAFSQGGGYPCAYAVQDDQIVLLPTPSTGGDTLRILYEYQPGKLIAASSCAHVANYAGAGDFECDDVPAAWTTSTTLDLLMGTSPFSLLSEGLVPSAVVTGASGTVTVDPADISSRVATGDSGFYLCPTGYTCVPQIPADIHAVLALAVAVEVLDQVGDPLSQPMRGKLELALRRAQSKLQPRVKGAPLKIVSKHSYLRKGRARRWSATLR